MNILVLIAIVGIGYLLYRSVVIKREPDHKPAVTHEETPDDSATQARVTTQASSSQVNEPGPSAVKQADIVSDVGQEAERAAVNAQATAVEKAHQQQALDAKQTDLEPREDTLTEVRVDEALQETPEDDVVPPVPDQIAAQVGALQETQEPLARHRLYQQIVDLSYRQRSDERYRQALHLFAPAHIDEFSSIAPLLKAQNGGKLPQVTTFKHYAAVLTEAEQYDEAIAVCEQAREYGLKDGTKSGYVGRIERINKLKARDAAD